MRCGTGTQVLSRAQAVAAKVTGLPPEKVTVHNHLLGGAFGRRLEVDGVERAVQIAKQVEGPVKVIWSREEDIRRDMFRPYFYDRVSAGLGTDGRPVAWSHRITGSSILKRWAPPALQERLDPDTVDGAANLPYALPNILVEYVDHEPPHIPTAFWRGVGPTHNVFVVESFIDELAAAAKTGSGRVSREPARKEPRAKAVLQLAAEKAGWGQPLPNGAAAACRCSSRSAPIWRRLPKWKCAKTGEVRVEARGLRRGLRRRRQPGHGPGADPKRGAVRHRRGAIRRDHVQERPRRAIQFPQLPDAADQRGPIVQVHIVPSTEAPGGMGEPGTSALAPAVTNAIFAATGKRFRKLPIDPAQLRST